MKFFTKDFEGREKYHSSELATVVLFHGFGANADDLFSLNEILDPDEDFNWFFPQGILGIPLDAHWEGRAWWTLDLKRLQNMGKPVWDYDQEVPVGLDSARLHAENILAAAGGQKVILGGFSQGAMLAVDVATSISVQALLLFSGALIAAPLWKSRLDAGTGSAKGKLPFFLSHGQQDQVLPLDAGEKLYRFLTDTAHWQGSLYRFSGGHEIPLPVMNRARTFLVEQRQRQL